jgi:thioredoxin-like negative regulator of GroEL
MPLFSLVDQNFRQGIVSAPVVFVDFYSLTCGPCAVFRPIFERVAQRHPGAGFGVVNYEQAPDEVETLDIHSVPTLIVFRGGQEVQRHTGVMNEAQFETFVRGYGV